MHIRRWAPAAAAAAALGLSAAPANGAALPVTGFTALAQPGRVVLAWQQSTGASGYVVYRGTNISKVTTAVSSTLSATTTTFTDTKVTNGTTYYYDVVAVSNGNNGPASALAQVTPRAASCSTGNAVVVENCFPGSQGWKTTAPFDAAHGGIEGFAGATSINAGSSVRLFVNTTANVAYHIEIYRSGYYGGNQGRLISVMPKLKGVAQPACNTNATTGLLDCSNWTATTTLTTTADWPAGVYLLRLVREDDNTDNELLLVIRRDAAAADALYTVPVTTYQAYNNYGGKSLYTFNSSGANTVAGTPRAVKVSFDRPFAESVQTPVNWYTVSDVQNLSWLEQQGYSLAYATSLDLQAGTANPSTYKAYISPSHDEYWSAEMRSAVTAARNAGTSLLYLGANADYWKIRFESSPYSGVANRVQVCYKSTESGGPDPSGIPTGTWRDPSGANQPENALIGQMFVGENDGQSFPLQVNAAQGQNRVWRYTSLATLGAGTTASIGISLVGWEWDARVANGAEPPGVTTAAGSAASGDLLTDAGKVFAPGATTTTATEYRAASGAWVFGTGTNQWSRGLGLNAAGAGEPNPLIQQATMSVLGDMRVRPTTPVAGLTVDSLGTPSVTRITPTSGSTGLASSAAVSATFDLPIDPSTVTAQSFTLADAAGHAVAATVSFDRSGNTAMLVPQSPLAGGTTYTATVTTGVKTWAGTALARNVTTTFATAAFAVLSTAPASGATNAGSLAVATATFSQPADPATVTASSVTLTGPGGTAVAGSVAYDPVANAVTLTPSAPLQPGATYTATVSTAVHAADGTPLGAPVTWSFTVAQCPCTLMAALAPSSLHNAVQDGRVGPGPWSYELGTKIQMATGSQLLALRFYKDGSETGTHVGSVWDVSGNLLAQVTFTGETASGWQEQALAAPLALQPGRVYIVSVNINAFFVVTPAGLQTALSGGPATTVADGTNGVFGQTAGSFPSGSFNSSNYFVDAVVE